MTATRAARSRSRTSPSPAGYQNRTRAALGAYQVELPLGSRHLLTAGAEARARDGRDRRPRGGAAARRSAPTWASTSRTACCSAAAPTSRLGGRVERNDSYGTHAVPRAAPRPAPARRRGRDDAARERGHRHQGAELPRVVRRVVLRARQPRPRPRAQPTFDVGIEQRLFGVAAARDGRPTSITTTATRSRTRWSDFTTRSRARYVNLARRGRGASRLALEARPVPALQRPRRSTRYQDGEILESPSDFDPGVRGRPAAAAPAAPPGLALARRRVRPRGASGRRSSAWASAPTATSSASASTANEPYTPGYARLDARARVRGRPARGLRRRREPARRAVPGGPRLPGPRPLVRGGLRLGGPALRLAARSRGTASSSPRPRLLAPRAARPRALPAAAGARRLAQPHRGRAAVEMLPPGPTRRGHALGGRRRHVQRRRPRARRRPSGCRAPTSSGSSRCAPTSWSSRSTPTPTSCGCSRSRACATTA